MKLIDDKGRLFGKINVIDFLVILFLLGLTPILYYGYKIATYKPPPPSQTIIKLQQSTFKEFDVLFRNIPEKFLPLIQVGDKFYKKTENNKKLIGEIVKIVEKKQDNVSLADSKFQKRKFNVNLKKYFSLKVLLKLLVTPVRGELIFEKKALQINSEIEFSSDKYSINALMLPFTVEYDQTVLVTVQANNIIPALANVIRKGDTEILTGKEIVIAEVLEIINKENSKVFMISDGVEKVFRNPLLRDVTLNLKLLTAAVGEEVFFKNVSIKLGSKLPFSTEKYSFTGTIINILKK